MNKNSSNKSTSLNKLKLKQETVRLLSAGQLSTVRGGSPCVNDDSDHTTVSSVF